MKANAITGKSSTTKEMLFSACTAMRENRMMQ